MTARFAGRFARASLLALLAGCEAVSAFTSSSVPQPSPDEQLAPAVRHYRVAAFDAGGAVPARSVALASHGVVQLVPDDDPPMTVLHAELAVAGTDLDVPWTLQADTAQIVADGVTYGAIAASAERDPMPIALIAGGERHAIELYFPLPATGAPSQFALDVVGSTRAGTFRAEATFVGTTEAPAGARPIPQGGHWWFAPDAAWPQFWHRDGRITHRAPGRATVIDELPAATSSPFPDDDCDEW